MQLFKEFESKELVIATTLLYFAALLLISLSVFWTELRPPSKSAEFHKKSNLPAVKKVREFKHTKIDSYSSPAGPVVEIKLSAEEVTIDEVAYQLSRLLDQVDSKKVNYQLSCNNADCRVEILTKQLDTEHILNLANRHFIERLR